ncbi:DivIVA domain-containing protein [Aquihabitans sp. G128]|uniref:DivIVA domain-containing protein n=1 Tax=Aquihabitans sp. G128 TaxID=2849779 RepID=UPI001C24387B|nr:DivIVA domain-containing protein [Aquihabitans sp. G128]QXC59522.1 DivIVA domain-containing protein [Aquihabitans sp. G128]
MSLTPDQIAEKEFLVGLRGYDKDEVRSFLTTVADALRAASAPAGDGSAAPAEPAAPAPAAAGTDWANLGDEIAAVLRTAHEQAATLRSDAETEVAALRQQADADATGTRSAAEAHAEAIRAEAEQARAEAATKLTAAQDEALTLVAGAQDRVAKMLESSKLRAQQEAEASVAHLTAQIAELTSARDAAKAHLADLRTRLDKAIAVAEAPVPAGADGGEAPQG